MVLETAWRSGFQLLVLYCVYSWTFFTLWKKYAKFLFQPLFSPCFYYVSPCLFFGFQINSSSPALCAFFFFLLVWQHLNPLNVCLCESFPYEPVLPLMFCSYFLHIILYLCALPFYMSLICVVKNRVLPFLWIIVKRTENYGEMVWQMLGSSLLDLICCHLLVQWSLPGLIASVLT